MLSREMRSEYARCPVYIRVYRVVSHQYLRAPRVSAVSPDWEMKKHTSSLDRRYVTPLPEYVLCAWPVHFLAVI